VQVKRFKGTRLRTNADMGSAEVREFCRLDEAGQRLVQAALFLSVDTGQVLLVGTLTSHVIVLFRYCNQERQSTAHDHFHNPPVPCCVAWRACSVAARRAAKLRSECTRAPLTTSMYESTSMLEELFTLLHARPHNDG